MTQEELAVAEAKAGEVTVTRCKDCIDNGRDGLTVFGSPHREGFNDPSTTTDSCVGEWSLDGPSDYYCADCAEVEDTTEFGHYQHGAIDDVVEITIKIGSQRWDSLPAWFRKMKLEQRESILLREFGRSILKNGDIHIKTGFMILPDALEESIALLAAERKGGAR